MKSLYFTFLLFISLFHNFTKIHSQRQQWEFVGNQGFSEERVNKYKISKDVNNSIYVAYQASSIIKIKKFDGTQWVSVVNENITGVSFLIGFGIDSSNNFFIAYQDANSENKITVKKYKDSSWEILGNSGLAPYTSLYKTDFKLNGIGVPYLVFQDDDNLDKLTILKYDNTSWIPEGDTNITQASFSHINLTFDSKNTPYLSFQDINKSNKGTVMYFEDSNWNVLEKRGFTNGVLYKNKLTFNKDNVPHLAFFDSTNKIIKAVTFNGSNWEDLGDLNISIVNDNQSEIDFTYSEINNTFFLLFRNYSNSLSVWKYNQNWEWTTLPSTKVNSASNIPQLLFDDTKHQLYLAYKETLDNSYLSVKQVQFKSVFETPAVLFIQEGINNPESNINANNGVLEEVNASITYSIAGIDVTHFSIDKDNGMLTFNGTPERASPQDNNQDNIYELDIIADNGFLTTTQKVNVYVIHNPNTIGNKWNQKNNDIINGDQIDSRFGYSVATNKDGSVVAVGSYRADIYGITDAGVVRIYKKNIDVWQLYGDLDNLVGTEANELFGYSIDLNAEGTRIVVGSYNTRKAQVFEITPEDAKVWDKLGSSISAVGSNKFVRLNAVSFSEDGTKIAIGEASNNVGESVVSVHEFINDWTLFGQIISINSRKFFGSTIDLSKDGKRIAIGSPNSDYTSITRTGFVDIFDYDDNVSDWRFGSVIRGEESNDRLGYSLALSDNGKVIATSSLSDNNINGGNAGQVNVYYIDENNYNQLIPLGNPINGKAPWFNLGTSMSLSADGLTLAIGSAYAGKGEASVYHFNGTDWIQIDRALLGEADDDNFGWSVQLSSDGKTLISGVPLNDVNGENSGQVQIFNLVSAPVFESEDFVIFQEKTTGTVIDVDATYGEQGNISYLLSGSDASIFNSTSSGVITFKTPPEWSDPQDANKDNIYEITITATNTSSISVTQDIKVYVFPEGANGNNWQQFGDIIEGVYDGDGAGANVVLSGDGLTMAVGMPKNYTGGTGTPQVRVYNYNGGSWQQLGSEILGSAGLGSYETVAISADGKTIVLGSPESHNGTSFNKGSAKVYHYNGTDWEQLGNTILRLEDGDTTGLAVCLSKDGKKLAVSSPWYNNRNADGKAVSGGLVRVFNIENNTWVQVGEGIKGAVGVQDFGFSTLLSADGKRIAIGTNGTTENFTAVYEYKDNNWSQLGANILTGNPNLPENQPKPNISFNAEGNIVAIGYGNVATSGVNLVKVHQFINNEWQQIGNDIQGASFDGLGYDVDLSADGKVLAVGAPVSGGDNTGRVEVYKFINNDWQQLGIDIVGNQASNDRLGFSVSLNANGSRVAVGAPGIVAMKGYAKVFELKPGVPIIQTKDSSEITANSVSIGGHVLSNGGAIISERGVVYGKTSENSNPEVDGANITKHIIGNGLGSFSDTLSGLEENTEYSYRAYAINSEGVSYGELKTFTTSSVLNIDNIQLSMAISVYPNPTSGNIELKMNNSIQLKLIEIYNIFGKKVFVTENKTFSLQNLSSGLYFIKVNTNKGSATKRIVKY